ncbi:mercuric transporter MerT family protein [Hydrogenophaga sp.]|uniref:mercuric transporter MerT family protein n=1 Tax=Hydrogenophaga sp. TaxID=1904254 RepID=UPI003AF96105
MDIGGMSRCLISPCLIVTLPFSCCLGPLVLIMLGTSGAWISTLTLLEPCQCPSFRRTCPPVFRSGRIYQPVRGFHALRR